MSLPQGYEIEESIEVRCVAVPTRRHHTSTGALSRLSPAGEKEIISVSYSQPLTPADTAVAVTDGHDLAVPAQHGVEPRELRHLLAGLGIGIALQPPAGCLIEVDGDVTGVVVRLPAVVQQAGKRMLRDAAAACARERACSVHRSDPFPCWPSRMQAIRRRWQEGYGQG